MLTSNVTLSPLYAKKLFPNAIFENCSDFRIKSCRYNASSIEPGEVYVAMEDPSVDPSGVELARQRGAAAVIVRDQFAYSDSCPCLDGVPLCRVENPHAAYAEICQALYDSPGKQLQIIGVTGARGRRVVSYLIAKVLLYKVFEYLITLPFFISVADWLQNLVAKGKPPLDFRHALVMLACTFVYCVINYIGQRYYVFRPVKEK